MKLLHTPLGYLMALILLVTGNCAQSYIHDRHTRTDALKIRIVRRSGRLYETTTSGLQDRKRRSCEDDPGCDSQQTLRRQKGGSPVSTSSRSVSRGRLDPSPPISNKSGVNSPKAQSRSPSPAGSESPAWNARGFTTSGTPSSWGSRRSDSPWAVAEVKVDGPAVMRTRTHDSKNRRFENVQAGESGSRNVVDNPIAQVAAHVHDERGRAQVVGSARNVRVTLDARQGHDGGWVGKIDPAGHQRSLVRVPPGTKVRYDVDDCYNGNKAIGKLHGKGTVKAHCIDTYPSYYPQSSE